MTTLVIRKGDKEWRVTGPDLSFGKRVKPGAPLHDTEMVDDPKMIRAVAADEKLPVFVLMVSNAKDVTVEKP